MVSSKSIPRSLVSDGDVEITHVLGNGQVIGFGGCNHTQTKNHGQPCKLTAQSNSCIGEAPDLCPGQLASVRQRVQSIINALQNGWTCEVLRCSTLNIVELRCSTLRGVPVAFAVACSPYSAGSLPGGASQVRGQPGAVKSRPCFTLTSSFIVSGDASAQFSLYSAKRWPKTRHFISFHFI